VKLNLYTPALLLVLGLPSLPAQISIIPDADADGHTVALPDTNQFHFHAPGAAGVQVFIEELRLPPGARLILRSLTESGEPGAITAIYENVGPLHGNPFWSDAVPGPAALLELDFPSPAPFANPFLVTKLRHLTPAGLERLTRPAPATEIGAAGKTVFRGNVVSYQVRNGMAIYDGDIILGPADTIKPVSEKELAAQRESIGMTSTYYRWPAGVVPYEIDPALPNQTRITNAVDHWNTRLAGSLTIRPRNGEANYIRFTNSPNNGECWTYIGNIRVAGQIIMLGSYCGTGAVIHEIGHAVGLFHEQTREDRDTYIRVNYANITAGMTGNFDKAPTISDDIGAYDYGSIMHYSAYAFSTNGQPTIETIPAGIAIGQQSALSAGDIAGARALYPAVPTVTSLEATFPFTVRNTNGATDTARVYFQVYTSSAVPANTCHGFYERATNRFYLYNDALTTLMGPTGTLQNSQCRVNASTVTTAGTDLTLTLRVTLYGAYASTSKNLYIWATSNTNSGVASGWQQAGAWNPVAQPPSLAASAPSASTVATQSFTLTGRDANGSGDLQRFYFLVATNTSVPTGGCHGFYDRPANALYLYNDALSALAGPLTPGTASSIQNGQCRLNGAASSVTYGPTDIILTLNITRQGSFSTGAKNLYIWVTDTPGTGSGWQQASTWTLATGNQPPTLASAAPTAATAATQTFTLTARDPDGATNLQRIYFLINSNTTIPTGGCHGLYDRASNAVFLYNDGLSSISGLLVGTANTIQNSQCRINGAATTVTTSGTDLVLNLNITRQGGYATGAKTLYTWVTDNDNNGSGWQQAATWTLAGATNQVPTLVSSVLNSSTYTITARDADGATDLQRIYFLLNSNTSIPTGSCHGVWDRATNAIYLYNDALTAISAFVIGTGTNIQNSQCRINAAATSVTSSGTDTILNLSITRQGSYTTGTRNLYLWLTDSAANNTGWLQ
jgi:astacin